jgi:hypothetical protein
MNYNSLAEDIHDNAKAKGFYDNPPSLTQRVNLLNTEITEAVEADREGKWFPKPEIVGNIRQLDDETFFAVYTAVLKPCFEAEIADVFIRLLDLVGYQKFDLDASIASWQASQEEIETMKFPTDDLQGALLKLTCIATNIADANYPIPLTRMFMALLEFCEQFKIDYHSAIADKMRYNSLRSRMHGGKKY